MRTNLVKGVIGKIRSDLYAGLVQIPSASNEINGRATKRASRSSDACSDDGRGRLAGLILSHPLRSLPSFLPSLPSVPSPPPSSSSSPATSPRPMPARTLPTASPDPALSPPRFYTRVAPHTPPSSHPHRDTYDDRIPESPFHAVAMPPPNARMDPDYTSQPGWSSPPLPRVYPDPSSIPPHWQINPVTIQQFREGRTYPHPPPMMPSSRLPWQNPYTRTLQAQPFSTPPPPPLPHKVWILDCKGCGTFLTNRGMKVSKSNPPDRALALYPVFPFSSVQYTITAHVCGRRATACLPPPFWRLYPLSATLTTSDPRLSFYYVPMCPSTQRMPCPSIVLPFRPRRRLRRRQLLPRDLHRRLLALPYPGLAATSHQPPGRQSGLPRVPASVSLRRCAAMDAATR